MAIYEQTYIGDWPHVCCYCGGTYSEFGWEVVADKKLAHHKCAAEAKAKTASYLQQENSVLHERVRKLEIALEAEREANAKIAEEYGKARYHYEAEGRGGKQDAYTAAKHIAALIRGRGEEC